MLGWCYKQQVTPGTQIGIEIDVGGSRGPGQSGSVAPSNIAGGIDAGVVRDHAQRPPWDRRRSGQAAGRIVEAGGDTASVCAMSGDGSPGRLQRRARTNEDWTIPRSFYPPTSF